MKISFVVDAEDVRNLISNILTHRDYEFEIASDELALINDT